MNFRKATKNDVPFIVKMIASDTLGKLREDYNLEIESRTVGNYREKLGLLAARFRKWPC